MRVKITEESKFGKSVIDVDIQTSEQLDTYKARLRRIHHSDNATVTLSCSETGYWEQVV